MIGSGSNGNLSRRWKHNLSPSLSEYNSCCYFISLHTLRELGQEAWLHLCKRFFSERLINPPSKDLLTGVGVN